MKNIADNQSMLKSLRLIGSFSISILLLGIIYLFYNNSYVEYNPIILMCNGEYCDLQELKNSKKFTSSFILMLKECNENWKMINRRLYIKRKLNNDLDLMSNYTKKTLLLIMNIDIPENFVEPNKYDWDYKKYYRYIILNKVKNYPYEITGQETIRIEGTVGDFRNR